MGRVIPGEEVNRLASDRLEIASDTSRPIGVRILSVLPATVRQLRAALPDLAGRQISSALNTQRAAGRVCQVGETWHRVAETAL